MFDGIVGTHKTWPQCPFCNHETNDCGCEECGVTSDEILDSLQRGFDPSWGREVLEAEGEDTAEEIEALRYECEGEE